MSTSSTSSSVASSLITIQTFSGQSTYSSDFQQILNKAVQAQEIPLDASVDQVNSDTSRQSALQTIDTDLTSLQTAVNSLTTSIGSDAVSATVSDPSVATATVSGATAGTYQLTVGSLGSATQTISTGSPNTVTDPSSQDLSTSSSYTLTVNGTSYTIGVGDTSPNINMAGNTLNDLVAAINENSSTLGVTASVVNLGSSSSPDYRLALQTTTLGAATIQLSDGTNKLLPTTATHTGAEAQYTVDGSSTIYSNTDNVTLAPGLTVDLLNTTTDPVTITVSQSTSGAATALQNLATAYNQVVTDLAAQHGENAGALSGESLLLVAQEALQSITNYTQTIGGVSYSLSNLGLSLTDSGDLSFDQTQFDDNLGGNFSDLSSYLGDAADGFIGNATNALNMLEDPTTGAVKTEENAITSDLTSLNTKITNEEATINSFQNTLVQQLALSDAAIATLQSQNTFFSEMFQTENASNNAG